MSTCFSCKRGRNYFPQTLLHELADELVFFLQVLLPRLGDIPPSPPGLQEQLDAVASFSTFKKLLEVSSSVVVVRTDVSKFPTHPLQVGLNFDQLVSKGRPSVSYHPKVIF